MRSKKEKAVIKQVIENIEKLIMEELDNALEYLDNEELSDKDQLGMYEMLMSDAEHFAKVQDMCKKGAKWPAIEKAIRELDTAPRDLLWPCFYDGTLEESRKKLIGDIT